MGADDSLDDSDDLALATYAADDLVSDSVSDPDGDSDSDGDSDPDPGPAPDCPTACGLELIDCLIGSGGDTVAETACQDRYTGCLGDCG